MNRGAPFTPLPPAAEDDRAPADAAAVGLPAPPPLPGTIRHPRLGVPAATWHYRDPAGALLFAVARFEKPDGGKEVLPLTCDRDGWSWRAPPAPRPLYGLDRLAARPEATVLVVEGEKTADAAATIFPDLVAITWPGGAMAATKADWGSLRGRDVVIWPDNDEAGRKAAAAVAQAARAAGAASVAVVQVPRDWPDGWDLADPLPEGATADTLRDMLAQAMAEPTQEETPGDALRADVARAAAMAREDWLASRLDIARKHRVPVAELDALRAEALRAQRQCEKTEREASEPPTDLRGRIDLLVKGADLPDTAAELAAMLATLPHLFDRAGPVRVARDQTRDGFVVEALTINGVVNEAHNIARPWQWVRNRETGELERRDVTLPERVAKLYLDNREKWGLRPLDGITSALLLHPDGTIRTAEGYDPETRL
jgi:hypothetical protein